MKQTELFRSDAKIANSIRRCASLIMKLLPDNYERVQAVRKLREAQAHALMSEVAPCSAVRDDLERARREYVEQESGQS